MQFDETGNPSGPTLMLLPGTACDYQTNFDKVLDRMGEKYHLICVNYDGFDGSDLIFPDMITVTEKDRRLHQRKIRWSSGWCTRLFLRLQLCRTTDSKREYSP